MTDRQARILAELKHGAADLMTLAGQLDEPPFAIRAELYAMRRERIVRNRLTPERHLWQLTDEGMRLAWSCHQLRLEA